MLQKQKIYLKLGGFVISVGLILTLLYRPFIYSNNVNDFGFADTIGSLVSVMGFCFIAWYFKDYSNKKKNLQIIIITFLYSVVWESFGYLGIYGIFDWKDMVAVLISGILTFFIKTKIERRFSTLV